MRFSFPGENLVTEISKNIKKLYKKEYFKFIESLNLKTFCIISELVHATVVTDPETHRIDVFIGKNAHLTCHYLFSGNEKNIDQYGFSSITISEYPLEEITKLNLTEYIKRYKFFKENDLYVTYFNQQFGQIPFVLNKKESDDLDTVVRYLLAIMNFFSKGSEEFNEFDEDTVGAFVFNEEEGTYDAVYIPLDKFNFLPTFHKSPKSKKVIEVLSDLTVNDGVLLLGQTYGISACDVFKYSNASVGLFPISMFGIAEDKLSITLYSSLEKDVFKKMKQEVLGLITEVGLYDTIVTDNVFIYNFLYNNLKELGIEVQLVDEDYYITMFGREMRGLMEINSDKSIDELRQVLLDFAVMSNEMAHAEIIEEYEEDDDDESVDGEIC